MSGDSLSSVGAREVSQVLVEPEIPEGPGVSLGEVREGSSDIGSLLTPVEESKSEIATIEFPNPNLKVVLVLRNSVALLAELVLVDSNDFLVPKNFLG